MSFNCKYSWPWSDEATYPKMMIKEFRSRTENLIPNLGKVKQLEDQCDGLLLIKLEWCGMQCSGKYGLFLKLNNYSTNRLGISDQSSADLNSSDISSKKIYKSAVDSSNATAYSRDQIEEILKGNENEISLLCKIRHENIITLFGVNYDKSGDTLPLLVMEGVHCDLYYHLNNSKFISWDEDLRILQGICNGLIYLHEGENIVHKNITTRSILLTKNLVVKLSSFEFAVKFHKDGSKAVHYSSDLLSFGSVISVMGSLKYGDTCTTDGEGVKKLTSLFEMCANAELRDVTSYDILQALNNHIKMPAQKTKTEMLDELKRLKEENQKLQKMIQENEENRFKLTNSFSKVDSRSAVKLSEEYKCIQHHDRLAAARAHKNAHVGCDPVPFHEHTMVAFEKAKELIFTTFKQYLERSLFQLQKEVNDASTDGQTLNVFRLMLNDFYEEHNLAENPTESIKKALDEAYENHVGTKDAFIPEQVKGYYEKLAKFTWTSATKAIPMVPSMEADKFDDTIHELKDDPEDDDYSQSLSSTDVDYIYPTLFVSNNWPREVAAKGKIKIV